MNTLTEIELSYIAGFFDGEGCVSISKYKGKNSKTPTYSIQVIMTQKNETFIRELQQKIGIGSVNNHHLHKDIFDIRLSCILAKEFLVEILPYLKIKKEQAQLAIEFQNKQTHKISEGKGWIVPEDIINERNDYCQLMHNLKKTPSQNW